MLSKPINFITNETKGYLKGMYGHALGTINESVRAQALGNETPISIRPADLLPPELDTLTREIGDKATSIEDTLSYALFPAIALEFFEEREKGEFKPEPLDPPKQTDATPVTTNERLAPTEFNLTIHGEEYHIKIEGTGHAGEALRPFYIKVDNMLEEVMVETLTEIVPMRDGSIDTAHARKGSRRPKATADNHVTSPMPGRITAVHVTKGDAVEAGDVVVVVEAMKMENPVHAPVSGTIGAIHIEEGDNVNPDECLMEIL